MGIKEKKKTAAKKEAEVNKKWLEIAPWKRMDQTKNHFIELANGYGFLNLLSVAGKDLDSLGNEEVQRALASFHKWLTEFTSDFQIESTKLPTNTSSQTVFLKAKLAQVRQLLKDERNERKRSQLFDREQILLNNLSAEEQIQKEIYNVEFVLYLWGDNPKQLEDRTRKAISYGGGEFRIRELSEKTKEQVLKQYNNMNEKL